MKEDTNDIMDGFQHEMHQAQLRQAHINTVLLGMAGVIAGPEKIEAVDQWVRDEHLGITGLKAIATSPIGRKQKEEGYFEALGGWMWVDQYTGVCGDSYHGTLCIQLSEEFYLHATFQL